jgi:hypothetical protein
MTNGTNSLNLSQIQGLLRTTPQTLENTLKMLDVETLRWRPAPEEWCINECIGHIIETDINGFAGRIQTILNQDRPRLVAWDVAGTVARRRDCERDGFELLAGLAAMRRENTRFIAQLTSEQMTRSGIHTTVGELRVVDLLFEWIHHDHNHVKQIMSNVQAYIWPDLGNAQRFFEPELNPFL